MDTIRFSTTPSAHAAPPGKAAPGERRHAARLQHLMPLAALWLAATAHADTATPPPPSTLGAHTLLVQSEGRGTDPAVTAPVDTQASGSTLLVLVGGYAGNATTPTDTYGNQWQPLGDAVDYRGYDGKFSARAFVATQASGGKDHRVRIAKPGYAEGEITVPFIEIEHAGVLQAVAQNYPAPGLVDKLGRDWHRATGWGAGGGTTLTSGKVTTTGPATLVAVWWGDSRALRMTAVPDHGFKVIDQRLDLPPNSAVQCAVAVKQVDGPGTWDVSWTGTPAQGAILWLFAIGASPR